MNRFSIVGSPDWHSKEFAFPFSIIERTLDAISYLTCHEARGHLPIFLVHVELLPRGVIIIGKLDRLSDFHINTSSSSVRWVQIQTDLSCSVGGYEKFSYLAGRLFVASRSEGSEGCCYIRRY